MAYTNAWGVTQKVDWGTLDQFQDSLMTASLATPYMGLNNTSMYGSSQVVRYPVMYRSQAGLEVDSEKINSTVQRLKQIAVVNSTDENLSTIFNVPIAMSAIDFTFNAAVDSVDSFWEEYVFPMAIQGGGRANGTVIREVVKNFAQTIGSPTTPLSGLDAMQAITAQFSLMGLNGQGQCYFAVSPLAFSSLQVPYASYFNQNFNSPILNDNLQAKGGNFSGIDVYMDQQVAPHTNGTWDASGDVTVTVVAGTGDINAPYSTLTLTGFNEGATVNLYDRVFIGAITPADIRVKLIDPQYKFATTQPKTFIVVEAATADSDGNLDLKIFPPIVPAGSDSTHIGNAYQNVNRTVNVDDVITPFGAGNTTYMMNFCWVKPALLFGNPQLYYSPIQPAAQKTQPMFALSPFQRAYKEKIGKSALTTAFDIMSMGDILSAANTIVLRTATAPCAFEGYGFIYASSV